MVNFDTQYTNINYPNNNTSNKYKTALQIKVI